jgi:hypothetical protein
MSTVFGKVKEAIDNQIRITAQATTQGTSQNKGTATDFKLTILACPDGGTAVAGTTYLYVQGANISATATSNWTTVTPDKGTATTAVTASGTQTLHFAQNQYQYYHLGVSNTAASTVNLFAVWDFAPVEDSLDATVQ